jgi:hypothetical protein
VPAETLLGIPKEYAFLLIGLIVGGLLGGWIGRAVGIASAAAGQVGALAEAGLPQGVSLVVNGRNVEISVAAMLEIQGLLKSGKTLEALTALRRATGLGMEEAQAVLGSLDKVVR